MSLTRKMLKAMSIEDEKIDQIIEAHTETVEALKEERDNYKEDAEKLPTVQKELNKIKTASEKDAEKNPWKVKYDAIKEEFETYKKDVHAKDVRGQKEEAYRKLLKEVGVSEKRINAVVKVFDLDSMELEEDGSIKDADALKKSVKEEWADFIPEDRTKGANTPTPPANNGGKMSKEDILAIKDTVQRQKAMLENKELFIE